MRECVYKFVCIIAHRLQLFTSVYKMSRLKCESAAAAGGCYPSCRRGARQATSPRCTGTRTWNEWRESCDELLFLPSIIESRFFVLRKIVISSLNPRESGGSFALSRRQFIHLGPHVANQQQRESGRPGHFLPPLCLAFSAHPYPPL